MLTFLRHNLLLIALFMLALPVFCWLRWQPQAWLAGQLAANNLTGQLTYTSVEKTFPGLVFKHANIHFPDGKQVVFDKILLRVALLSLFEGKAALFFHLERDGLMAQGDFSLTQDKLEFSNINIRADAAKLSVLDARLQLLGLKGQLQLGGNMQLRRTDAMPLSGDIHAAWKQAATLLLPTLKSGSIDASLVSKEVGKPAPVWNWQINSTTHIISGKGKLIPNGAQLTDWLLHGNIHLKGRGINGDNILSGTLGAPHWQ